MTAIKYTIDIPEDAIPELEALMAKHGAYFDRKRQITAINDVFMESCTAMGHHVPTLAEALNLHLRERDLLPLVPEDHKEWGPERTQAFLQMAVTNFQWVDGAVSIDWWEEDGKTWREVTLENPGVFGKNPE